MIRAILRTSVLFTALYSLCVASSGAGAQAGSLVAWGNDPYGLRSRTPKTDAYRAISAGGLHNVALGKDGTLTVWGDDGFGQISNAPSGSFLAVCSGYGHSAAIRTDGTLV